MGASQLKWSGLEELVASEVRSIYAELENAVEQKRFLRQLRAADQELLKLSKGHSVDYSLDRVGEAYALKYHLSRADNVAVTLREIHNVRAFSGQVRVLDIGSGTGCGAMALGYWALRNLDLQGEDRVHVYCVEPAVLMRRMAFKVLRPFHDRIMKCLGLEPGASEPPFHWHPCRAITMEEATWLANTEQFDLILFSYTFSAQDSEVWRTTMQTVVQIVEHLSEKGVACFLTPRIASKQELMDRVADQLSTAGFSRQDLPVVKGLRGATVQKRPQEVIDVRREFNEECRRLSIPDAFGEDPQFDDPYYGFYGKLDLFSRA